MRVEVEIDYVKRDKYRGKILDIDIYELVDDSLSIVPPNDNLNNNLIIFKRVKALDDISEMKLALYQEQTSFADENSPPEKNVTYKKPMIFNHTIFNWDNLSNANSSDLQDLSKYLKDHFDLDWADAELINISGPEHRFINGKKKELIYINSTKDKDDWVLLQTDDRIGSEGIVLMDISGQRSYLLRANSKEKGKRWINDWNGVLSLHLDNLSTRERLYYWYYIKPKKSGISHTESLVRINDAFWKGCPDITYP